MNSIKKITASVLAAVLAAGSMAYAADGYLEPYEYMDDIYKFDVGDFAEQANAVTGEKQGKYYREGEIVSAFGFMDKESDGSFREEDNLTYTELAVAMLRINSGKNTDMESRYSELEERTVPMSEAVGFAASTLGYDYLAKLRGMTVDEAAAKYGMLDGLGYIPEKYITRGEFARLVYNLLELPMFVLDVSGKGGSFDDEDTILERHDVIKIKGFLNGYQGVNVYAPKLMDKDSVYIDGVEYEYTTDTGAAALGDNVLAYAVREDNAVIYLESNNQKENISFKLTDIENVSETGISYTLSDGTAKRVSLSDLDYIVYNGVRENNLSFLSALSEEDGTVKICRTEVNGRYNCVIVTKYDDFVTRATDSYEKIIYLKYDAGFEGEEYISVEDEDEVFCTLDGIPWNPLELGNNVAISVVKNSVNGFMTIVASTKRENTKVTEFDGDILYMGEKEYRLASSYREAMAEGSAENIVIGQNGVFYVTQTGFIAGYTNSTTEQFGYLRRIFRAEDTENTYQVTLFTQDAEWVTLTLKDKITLDGDIKVDSEEVLRRIKENGAERNFVRFKQSNSGLVTFLDTIVDSSTEKTDEERIVFKSDYYGKVNWTAGFSMPNTEYRMDENTYVFAIPDNEELMEKFNVVKGCVLPVDSYVTLSYYSPDEFNVVSLVKYAGSLSSSSSVASQDVYIDRVQPVWNEELGETEYKLKVYIFKSLGAKGKGTMEEQEYLMSDSVYQDYSTVARGDMCTLSFYSDGTVSQIKTLVPKGVMPAPYDSSDSYTEIGCGTIAAVDPDTKMVLVDVNGEMRSFAMRAIGIYDTAEDYFRNASAGELRVGDKIFYKGVVGHSIANYIVR
ncbi:MAG: hypothetical protein IJ366_07495 [Clostridia bacterium]|nr:hypothetical protein [Clostridia bacterium]